MEVDLRVHLLFFFLYDPYSVFFCREVVYHCHVPI
nr:MAG TPA: hypothetical protein [Caudoviricetes sp.]